MSVEEETRREIVLKLRGAAGVAGVAGAAGTDCTEFVVDVAADVDFTINVSVLLRGCCYYCVCCCISLFISCV